MTLTKHDLLIRISEETGLVQTQVFDAVQKTLDQISEGLAKGGKVELRNFGVFEVKITKARVGRNPKQPGTDVPIPARTTVKFKAGKEMKAEVLKLTPKTPQEMSVMTTPSTWFYWALLSAVFAALTDIFAKIGIQGVDSDFATLIYTRSEEHTSELQ